MSRYEIMKEDAILGPFDINEIAEFVSSGLILKKEITLMMSNTRIVSEP